MAVNQTVKVGLLGLGVVGQGVYQILEKNGEEIARRCGGPIEISRVLVRDRTKARDISVPSHVITTDPWEIINDPDISIIVEVIGGIEHTRDMLLAALRNGKSIVTANKDLIALHGVELFTVAEQNHRDFLYEASVGGGIPIIRPLKQCLASNRISEVIGIINGTTNFILSKMSDEGMTFEAALSEAQQLGYAESDPTADVGGHDAARKIAIVASLAFNTPVTYHDVDVTGIANVTDRDIRYAEELGYTIKLLAVSRETDSGITAFVRPALIPKSHPLASVHGVFNAIFIRADAIGEVMFHGLGAGRLPTASAVTGDIVEAVRNLRQGSSGALASNWHLAKPVVDAGEIVSRFYLRMLVIDRPGVLAAIATVLGQYGISIASMLQQWSDGSRAELVIITHDVAKCTLEDAVQAVRHLEAVVDETHHFMLHQDE